MDFLGKAMKEFKSIYSSYLFLLILLTGLYTFFFEGKRLKNSGMKKEEISARIIGAGYVLLSVVTYIAAAYM